MRVCQRAQGLTAALIVLSAAAVIGQPAAPASAVDLDALIARMTLEEKLGQLQQLDGEADGRFRDEHLTLAREGRFGSTLNVRGASRVNQLQKAAVEQSRLRIPIIFAFDVIHGYRTVFPVPLAEAATWDPAIVEQAAAVAAAEARAAGLHWTFAPMVDIARDARWGRVVESAGEDPYLGAVMAAARVRGFQGSDPSAPDRVIACAKHWVAYGAAEAGRDYNTVDLSERTLRGVFFPPFKAAVDAGVGTVMTSFNALNGVPASANPFTIEQVLRGEWKFDGLVVSDYTSVVELIQHGVAADEADAARLALGAGVDMEMVSRSYVSHGPRLVREGRISERDVDEAVRRVLELKRRAGIFEQPYADATRERDTLLTVAHRQAARTAAARSIVLLKNDNQTLPLPAGLRRIALIGALADDPVTHMGSWAGDGRPEDVVTLRAGLTAALPGVEIRFAPGVEVSLEGLAKGPEATEAADRAAIEDAVTAARDADAVVLVLGETAAMSGEASSRSSIELPGRQRELAQRVIEVNKRTAVVLMNGRPLAIPWLAANAAAILEAWLPGTEGGHAIADVLLGKISPGGKLPVTFPRATGQVPIYYSHLRTGRPPDPKNKYTSKYLDVEWTPLYPFGHGLAYTRFTLDSLTLDITRVPAGGRLTVAVTVRNAGARPGDEVVQVYLRDPVGSVSRPVLELEAFARVTLTPGAERRLSFVLGPSNFGFYDDRARWTVEPGRMTVQVGTTSADGLTADFEIVGGTSASRALRTPVARARLRP